MRGTWEQLHAKGHTKVRWPGWSGFIIINRGNDGKWEYQSFDGSGKREPRGQRDYRPYAQRRQWESVD